VSSLSNRPWDKLNESLTIAQEAINYDPTYPSPSGYAEKITGDGSGEIQLAYRIVGELGVSAFANVTSTPSHTHFSPGWGAVDQNVDFNLLGYGIGAEYHVDVSNVLQLSANVGVQQVRGILDFEYKLDWVSFGEAFVTQLKDTRTSYRTGLQVLLRVVNHVNVLSGVEYRYLELPSLRGSGTYTQFNAGEPPHEERFAATLAEGRGYFGIDVTTRNIPDADRLRWLLWRAPRDRAGASSVSSPLHPTTLPLSAFGFTAGVRIDL
jgi:hypothetical protein